MLNLFRWLRRGKSKLIAVLAIGLLCEMPLGLAAASPKDVQQISALCTNIHRAIKDYSLVGMGVKYGDPGSDLTSTIAAIDEEFSSLLLKQHLGTQLTALLDERNKEWQVIRSELKAAPTQATALKIYNQTEDFSKKCWELADMVGIDTAIEGEHYVVVVAEMGADVQKIAAIYTMKSWEVAVANYDKDVDAILKDFEHDYDELVGKAYPKFVDDNMKGELESAEQNFLVFEHMALSQSGRFVPAMVSRTSSRIFDALTTVASELVVRLGK